MKAIPLALILAACAVACGGSNDKSIEEGTSCDEQCPVGANRFSAKSAAGSCDAGGNYLPITGSAEIGGKCVGSGNCQVVCEYPACAAGQTLKITEDAFTCEAGGGGGPTCDDWCAKDALCNGTATYADEAACAEACDAGFGPSKIACADEKDCPAFNACAAE
jgi:hypothetical protein